MLNLKSLQVIPETLYELKNGVQTILRIYITYLLKGDYQTTLNVIKMLSEYLNQLALIENVSQYKEYVNKKDIKTLRDTIEQYRHLSTINTTIIDRIYNTDAILIIR